MKPIILLFSLCFTMGVSAQMKLVTGTITDETGLALPGVSITIKGESIGTQTDFDGHYSIQIQTNQTLVFSFAGYVTKEIRVSTLNENSF